MVNSNMLMNLYTRVLDKTSFVNGVREKDVKEAIEQMHEVYQGSPDGLNKSFHCLTDYNEVAYRCAYLFKYAPFHTSLTFNAMSHALIESPFELRALLNSLSGPLKVCSLGGGPGADLIGAIAAMHNQFGYFRTSVKLVDLMSDWELTFRSILDELKRRNYGPLSESFSPKWFDWSYMNADLQSKMNRELTDVLRTADVVTMVKFVSAAASKETSNMIEEIFRMMKPGAFVLFVDNAAGGFKEMISSAAKKYRFNAISAPLKHQPYINEFLKVFKYGFKSCYESTVAVQLLMKSGQNGYFNGGKLIENWSSVFSPRLITYNARIDGPVNHYQSFESEPFYSPNPGASASPNWPVGVGNQICNVEYENESFKHDLRFESPSNWQGNNFSSSEFSPRPKRLNAQINDHESFESEPFCSSPHAFNKQNWHKNQIYDTGYGNESFEHMSLNVEYSNEIDPSHSKPNVTVTHDSGYFDESFQSGLSWDSPVHNSTPHFKASHRPGRISFKGINNSVYNQSPMNSELPLHQPWHGNRRPFGILQHSERPCIRQSKVLFSVPPSHQCPRNYKAPKRLRKVLKHQYKPYLQKRFQIK